MKISLNEVKKIVREEVIIAKVKKLLDEGKIDEATQLLNEAGFGKKFAGLATAAALMFPGSGYADSASQPTAKSMSSTVYKLPGGSQSVYRFGKPTGDTTVPLSSISSDQVTKRPAPQPFSTFKRPSAVSSEIERVGGWSDVILQNIDSSQIGYSRVDLGNLQDNQIQDFQRQIKKLSANDLKKFLKSQSNKPQFLQVYDGDDLLLTVQKDGKIKFEY